MSLWIESMDWNYGFRQWERGVGSEDRFAVILWIESKEWVYWLCLWIECTDWVYGSSPSIESADWIYGFSQWGRGGGSENTRKIILRGLKR